MTSSIPTIDFHRFDESLESRREIALEIDHALRHTGFFQLKGHGIDQGRIAKCFESAERFFQLPDDEKRHNKVLSASFIKSYLGVGEETIRSQSCIRESFEVCHPTNFFPDENLFPGFRDATIGLNQLLAKLLQCLALALDLASEHYFERYHTGAGFNTSFIRYPAISRWSISSRNVVRCPAHSDTGTLTLLFQHDIGGLEIVDAESTSKITTAAIEKSGRFIPVAPEPGMVVVNVGYLLMRWSNRRWKNTVHRVVEPEGSKITARNANNLSDTIPARSSIAFFASPDASTIVDPLPQCCSDENPKKWDPIQAGEYLASRKSAVQKV